MLRFGSFFLRKFAKKIKFGKELKFGKTSKNLNSFKEAIAAKAFCLKLVCATAQPAQPAQDNFHFAFRIS